MVVGGGRVRFIDAAGVTAATPWPDLIDALADAFRDGAEMPQRHHHTVPVPGDPDGTLLLMPCWRAGDVLGVKVANVFPGNAARNLPSVNGAYLLMSATTGVIEAVIDGGELTARRTAAASALSARYLARRDARTLLVVGTGRLAPLLAQAHAHVRPIDTMWVWGRSPGKAEALAATLTSGGYAAKATRDLEAAARQADVITCATLSKSPLIMGDWMQPGSHLDLVGAFRADMREADDDALARAQVFVDTRAGVLAEGGDVVQAIASGRMTASDIVADLAALCRGEHPGRTAETVTTVFKSVGAALEDLAAARLTAANTPE